MILTRLKFWIGDNESRVSMINKTCDFLGSAGTVTEEGCCLTDTCHASNGGQDTIKDSSCDDNKEPIEVTYNASSYIGMPVGSNKSPCRY